MNRWLRRIIATAAPVALAAVIGLGPADSARSSFRGANGNLTFTSLDGGIYVVAPNGGTPRDISNPAFFDSNPAWAPDGTALAFSGIRDGNLEILRMNARGDDEQRLTSNPSADWDPAWSPDGKMLAFTSSRGGISRVHVMDVSGSNVRALGPVPSGMPTWSPDGSTIAFAHFGGKGVRIALMAPDGSAVRFLTEDGATDIYPDWSPDGRQLAFVSDRGGTFEIWRMNADGSGQIQLTSGSRFRCSVNCSLPRFGPAWSPDGRRIGFAHDREGVAQAFVMNADGSGQTRISSHHMDVQDVAWQPATDIFTAVVPPRHAFAGHTARVKVVVRNQSPLLANGVTIRFSIRGPASIVSIRGRTCSRGPVAICRVGQVAASSAIAVAVVLRFRRPGRVTVTATAATTETDAHPTNNRARSTLRVRPR